ncbi:hypothetical protein BDP67DRAFT_590143 [Colletotrichum lupini]|nr:hypothetical protein BDP67DRAFT_590143 [Colletotrichum lupini]
MNRRPSSPCTDDVSEVSSVNSLSIRTSITCVQERSSREHEEPRAPTLFDKHQATKVTLDYDIPTWKVLPATSLINEAGSLLSQASPPQEPSRWRAIGTFGLYVLGIGTVFIIGAVGFMSFFWKTSIQAKEVVVQNTLWSQIVFADWASRSITLTAAALRVCLALQMSLFTAMIASLMIERTGISFSAAPFVSMLRAMPASPYSLISWTPFDMPWGIGTVYTMAITTSVLLTAASQLASTALLSDFAVVNVTAPQKAVNMLYGNSSVINPTVMQGSRIWKSKPWVYPRFAELQRQPTEAQQSKFFEDTGTILRAFIPFANEPSRSRLRNYEGPAAVVDSRVVCRVGVSVTACFANLQGHVQNVSMSSKVDGHEPILAWDSPNTQYTTNVIRDQYSSICKGPPGGDPSPELLELIPNKSWKSEDHRLSLDVVTSQLPFMTRSLHDPLIDPSPCGMLRTGGYSSRAVHYAHSALFQDVLRTSLSVPEALQAILTVTQQMSYYDTLPYFRNAWPATYAMTEEKLIPVRWVGFGIVVAIIVLHLGLVAAASILFLKLTTCSSLGNVWISLSQIVSLETEGLIQEATSKDDNAVEKMIWEAISKGDSGLRQRVKIMKNGLNGRNELSSF